MTTLPARPQCSNWRASWEADRNPRRTVIFALFGSEETGGQGSTYFLQHPPVPLKQITVNLEFEMLGRADPAVSADTVWLTGWERSNLGPMLAAHGAKLIRDPHPKENFFARSDNYVLAKRGMVAQTVSSYGLHSDYHQPSDDLAHIDFQHMDAAIGSLLRPVRWLVNSSFTPQWNRGRRYWADGSRIFWSNTNTGALYVRENTQPQSPIAEGRCTVPTDACTVQVAAAGEFLTASADGSKVFFTNGELYEYDLQTGRRPI